MTVAEPEAEDEVAKVTKLEKQAMDDKEEDGEDGKWLTTFM